MLRTVVLLSVLLSLACAAPVEPTPAEKRERAAAEFRAGRFDEAAGLYEGLVAVEPQDGALRMHYAAALAAVERYDEAERELTVAAELQPSEARVRHEQGRIAERRGDAAAAAAHYREALELQPGFTAAGQALRRLGVSPADPESAGGRAVALSNEAVMAARQGDPDEAGRLLDEAESLAPDLATVHEQRANVAFLAGDRDAAIAALERALELDPDNERFRARLEQLSRR
ncbi:MAG: tetratricopeptide repeat protein [bacterium]|nr:tetratricopeptide repeat protein [bacterium]